MLESAIKLILLEALSTFIEKNAKPSNSGRITKRADPAVLCISAKIFEDQDFPCKSLNGVAAAPYCHKLSKMTCLR